MKLICLYILSLFALATSQINTGCPKLPVEPCFCNPNPRPYLGCDNVDDTEALRRVFLNSKGISYNQVRFANSVLQYLPSNLFKNTKVLELEFYNSTFVQLFDETPEETESLRTIHIEKTYIFRGILWEHLTPMTNLRILNVYSNQIDIIGDDFATYVPKTLQQLSFYETKTTDIKPGVLANFPYLDKVAVDHCELQELRRNMFPVPFKGRVLYFNENMLRTLPDDLFTDMPNLQTVGLRGNSISTLPPFMFVTRFPKLQYFILDGNPLYCDHKLKWLIINKPVVLKGSCFKPADLHGSQLAELDPDKLMNYD
ncbi:leucine-rich repeat-containing protein 15-like [Parasteatoda tepidariorum]|uniref:leucine-rich repeat-containing protein 15-like n=1 Tax=Parasteatoda tepidariorum TaxID=114398 RepID=UPI001C7243B9|nr:slit homolog 1 protein-like [Parasteatoda tepidariorum]